MSLTPPSTPLSAYKGDGDWFKILLSGASNGKDWDSLGQSGLNVTIPKNTPPGEYLVRVEHFNISPYWNQTQMFVNCAQIEVRGDGKGKRRDIVWKFVVMHADQGWL